MRFVNRSKFRGVISLTKYIFSLLTWVDAHEESHQEIYTEEINETIDEKTHEENSYNQEEEYAVHPPQYDQYNGKALNVNFNRLQFTRELSARWKH